MSESIVRSLQVFTSPQDEEQLCELEHAIGALDPSQCGEPEFRAMLAVFERFPNDDGFGVFWSIVHLLEATSGYELALVKSVEQGPAEFNLLMVNRLLNAGVRTVAGKSLLALLRSVAFNEAVDSVLRETAARFIEHQREAGDAEA